MEEKITPDAYYTSAPNYCVRFFWDALTLKTHVAAISEEHALAKAVHNMTVMLSQPERLRLGRMNRVELYHIRT